MHALQGILDRNTQLPLKYWELIILSDSKVCIRWPYDASGVNLGRWKGQPMDNQGMNGLRVK